MYDDVTEEHVLKDTTSRHLALVNAGDGGIVSKEVGEEEEEEEEEEVQVRGECSFGARRDSLLAQLGPHGWPG